MLAKRFAALAEVLLVLALGNIIGEAIFPLLVSESVTSGSVSGNELAFSEGLLILLRLGSVGILGFAILYFRTGISPSNAGLSLNDHRLSTLVEEGLVLGLISGFLLSLLFSAHAVVPLGEGLPAWWTYSETPIDSAFWITLLGTSVLIPPLTEEIMTRGYMRVRLIESFGPMAGVVLTGLMFGLFHTRYISADPMLFLFLVEILFASVLWTYSAQRFGSILPAFVAHALSNGIGTAILFDVWVPLVMTTVGCILYRGKIKNFLGDFVNSWRSDEKRKSLWQGLAIIFLVLSFAMGLLNVIGRTYTLILLGAVCLVYTIGFLVWERRLEMRADS